MADKKQEQSGFKVTDRRLFTPDGELRTDVAEQTDTPKAAPPAAKDASAEAKTSPPQVPPPQARGNGEAQDREMPAPPTSAEQEAQAAAYRQSAKDLDTEVELGGHSAKDFEMTFERFMAQLYMTAMMQLGLMAEKGTPPRIDIIGARLTIDTLSLMEQKTKGNLTAAEANFLQNSLYELRMAYVEVTNALSRPPKNPGAVAGSKTR